MKLADENKHHQMFEFMLKEYEMLYSKFEMHYSAVEKTIGLYLLIIGAIVSANGFLIKDIRFFSIFELSEFQGICSFFVFIIGSITCLKVIEHRLLIITYVKNLNQNRKWFNEKVTSNELQKYSLFEATYKSPSYYKKYRHFYWEILGITIINSSFLSLFIINFFQIFSFESTHFFIINWIWFFVILSLSSAAFMGHYRRRAKTEEDNLKNKNLAE